MIIQNSGNTPPAQGFVSDAVPVAAATQPKSPPVDRPQQAAQAVAATQKPAAPDAAQIQGAVDNINKAMRQSNANVEFSIDKDTRQTVIKVVESGTGQVIRQFPSEDVIAIARAIDQMQQRGLLLKQEA